MRTINDCFEDLSHSLRILQEVDYRAHSQGLIMVDAREAIGNIESAYSSVLNDVHSLYDSIVDSGLASSNSIYSIPEISILLAIRNARHHNHARKVRTLYRFHLDESKGRAARYELINYPVHPDNGRGFEVYFSAFDFAELLELPEVKTRIRAARVLDLRCYLGMSDFTPGDSRFKFFNFIPILVNGCIEFHKIVGDYLVPQSTESKAFSSLFDGMQKTAVENHLYQELVLPPIN